MRPRDLGNRTVLDDRTFDDGLKVRHIGWTIFWRLLLLGFIGVFGGVMIQGTDFFLYKTFAPRMENVRREVFENTKSYRQGTVQTVQQYFMQYQTADDEHKEILRQSLLLTLADYDIEQLPPHLQTWVRQLRAER